MGSNKLNSLMKTMAEKACLNAENLTNHSARKRMIQKLNDREVPPTHIMQIPGHKNVQSLNNYSSLSEKVVCVCKPLWCRERKIKLM